MAAFDDCEGPTIFDFFGVDEEIESPKRPQKSARQRFEEFHDRNPHVSRCSSIWRLPRASAGESDSDVSGSDCGRT